MTASGFDKWEAKQPYIQGGGLKHKYKLVQFHLHWASHDHHGSEHKIGGLHYPAELHLVHLRSDLTLQQAVSKPDGLAVVAVFILIEHDASPMAALDKVIEEVVAPSELIFKSLNLSFSDNRTSLFGFRTRPMLPQSTDSFYRYEGSLTTPPSCAESVIWTLLAEPISMTRHQVGTWIETLRDTGN